MEFASDNAGPVHPQIIAALTHANEHYASGYGADALSAEVVHTIRETFEAPEAAVYLVATGTAANALILGTLSQPWETIFCTPMAHIHEDECNAPEFYTGGAKLTLVDDTEAKLDPTALRTAIEAEESRGVHGPQRGPISITQATEKGTVYTLDEITEISTLAREFNLPLHLDGARFTNALVRLGCTPAEMTWKAGVDAVSFGGTKNGLMGVEAAIFFDPKHAWEFELRRKRGAHLFSKHRYLAAQMQGYFKDDLWRSMARAANTASDRLLEGMRQHNWVEILHRPQANLMFATFPRAVHKRLHDAGAHYYVWDGDPHTGNSDAPLMGRFVCDWSTSEDSIDRFLSVMAEGA